ncbi:MAG: SDR family oxidoreductase [Rivularia sp. (in: cyanobacteria)]
MLIKDNQSFIGLDFGRVAAAVVGAIADDISTILSETLGRPVRPIRVSLTDFASGLNQAYGAPTGDDLADFYRYLEAHPQALVRDSSAAATLGDVMPLYPMNALKVEEWDNMINVNINGVLNGIAAGLPIMEAQGGGQFINTASIGAHVVVPTGVVYCATKYAVWAISEGLRQESQNIRVTTISPRVQFTDSSE